MEPHGRICSCEEKVAKAFLINCFGRNRDHSGKTNKEITNAVGHRHPHHHHHGGDGRGGGGSRDTSSDSDLVANGSGGGAAVVVI